MAKIPRVFQRLFGSSAGVAQIGKFGSLAAGTPAAAADIEEAMSLSNWLDGWFGAVVGENSPCIEDANAVAYVFSQQIAYLLQAGIPEYDEDTIYYIGDLARVGTTVYESLVDDNEGELVTDGTKWKIWRTSSLRTVIATGNITNTDEIVRIDSTSGVPTMTLPTVASSVGQKVTAKWVNNGSFNKPILKGNGAELIELANTLEMQSPGDAITLFNNGTNWEII